jgi:hypothetical protein
MDPRVETYAPLGEVASADLNLWQDRTREARAADTVNNLLGGVGGSLLCWQADTQMTSGTMRVIDNSVDWRDRWVKVLFVRTAQGARTGQGGSPGDTAINDVTSAGPARSTSCGYTGTGAFSNTTFSTSVSNGNPPLNAVGTARSYAVTIDDLGTGPVYLFVDPDAGTLYLYNDSGATLWPYVEVDLSGDLGMR